jgi:hypothetical protein
MPECIRCRRKGVLLKLNKNGLCMDCITEEVEDVEFKLRRQYQHMASGLEQQYEEKRERLDREFRHKYRNTKLMENKAQEIIASQNQKEDSFKEKEASFKKLLSETNQKYPWLAQQIADFYKIYDDKLAENMRNKTRPAIIAADNTSKANKEKRIYLQNKSSFTFY